jgi:hypothetical protein
MRTHGCLPCLVSLMSRPEATDTNSTLVEFTLTAEGDHTRLTLVESGFAAMEIPPERYGTASYESHSAG